MKASLHLELEGIEKELLRSFLITTFNNGELNGPRWPLGGYRIALYLDGKSHHVMDGAWAKGSGLIHLPRSGGYGFSMAEKLLVLCTLRQACDSSEELTRASSQAIGRYLLGEFNQFNQSLIVSVKPSTGLALRGGSEPMIASLIEGVWMTASGVEVDVSGAEWMVCKAPEPMVEEPVVASSPDSFTAGQRVRFTNRQDQGPETGGVGTVVRENRITPGLWLVRTDDGNEWWVEASAMSVEHVFAEGDRVRYSQIPGTRYGAGVGTLRRQMSNGSWDVESETQPGTWAIPPRDLSPLDEEAPSQVIDARPGAFSIGDRVRYSRIPHINSTGGTGTISGEPYSYTVADAANGIPRAEYQVYDIREDGDRGVVYVLAQDLVRI